RTRSANRQRSTGGVLSPSCRRRGCKDGDSGDRVMTVATSPAGACVLDREALERTIKRIAHEIIERYVALDEVVIAGIRSGGVPVAAALARAIDVICGTQSVELAAIDVLGY